MVNSASLLIISPVRNKRCPLGHDINAPGGPNILRAFFLAPHPLGHAGELRCANPYFDHLHVLQEG